MAAGSAAADRAAAAQALRAHLARLGREPRPVRWVARGEIQVRAAESAALRSIVPARRSAVGPASDWPARTSSAPGVLFAFAVIGGALLGALAGLGGGVAGGLLGASGGAVVGSLLGGLIGGLLALACADRVGLAIDRGASALGGGVGTRRRAAAGAEVGDVLGRFLGLLGGPIGAAWGWIGLVIGIVGGPVVGAFVGALLGALIGAVASGIETLSRASFRAVASALDGGLARVDRVAAAVLAGASVGAFASVLGMIFSLGLGARPGVAIGAGLGATLGSFLGAGFGAATRSSARWIALWHPLPSSSEAALWLFWPSADEYVAVSSPALRLTEGALHCEDGPAVVWPPGVRGWFWHGAPVPGRLIERPEALSGEEIRREPDPEVRLAMVDRLGGIEHFMRKVGAELVQQDDYGRLWRGAILPPDSGPPTATVVEVRDTTSGAVSLLRVPPTTRTARGAVAWTFGFERAQEYAPAVET